MFDQTKNPVDITKALVMGDQNPTQGPVLPQKPVGPVPTIDMSQTGTSNLKLQPTQTTPPPDISTLGNGTAPTIPTAPTTPTTPEAGKFTRLLSSVQGISDKILGKNADLQSTVDAATLPYETQLNDINSQIKMHQATSLQQQEDAMNRVGGTTTSNSIATQQVQRTNAIEALKLSAIADTLQGNIALAEKKATTAVNAKYAQVDQELSIAKQQIYDNYDSFSPAEKKRADATLLKLDAKDAFVAQQKEDDKTILGFAAEAAKNGANTTVLNQITNAKNPLEALKIGAKYMSDPTAKAQALANLDNTRAQTRKINAELSTTGNVNVSTIVNDPTIPNEQKNSTVLTTLLKNPKIGQGTRTQLANILGVTNALQDVASANSNGLFTGVNPINTILNAKIPFTDVGIIPFRQAAKQDASIQNEQYVNAINLKVQQWASGASLTKQQTDQVEKLTPSVTDTDANFRTKVTGLANFMLTQAKSNLQSEGINFEPAKVDLFETYNLLQKASPEQLKELGLQ